MQQKQTNKKQTPNKQTNKKPNSFIHQREVLETEQQQQQQQHPAVLSCSNIKSIDLSTLPGVHLMSDSQVIFPINTWCDFSWVIFVAFNVMSFDGPTIW